MKLQELLERVKKEHINIQVIRAIIGEKVAIPNATGCFQDENGVWNIYAVSERGSLSITESGNEETILEHFYSIMKGLENAYREYGDVWS